MKILPRRLIVLAIVSLAAGAYGQGQVYFNTRTLGTSAQVYDDPAHGGYLLGATNYGPGYQGTNWFAQLYAAAGTGVSSSVLVPVGRPVNFGSGTGAGYVQSSSTTTLGWPVNPFVTIPFLSHGGPATIQLRAWWGDGTQITNYEAAMVSSHPNSRWGTSPLLYLTVTGDPTATPPGIPVGLVGSQGFQLGKIVSLTPPVIVTQPHSQDLVVGQNVILTVAASGSIPLGYQWSNNGTNLAGATTALLALANVQRADAGNYRVMVTNAAGSVASSNAVVTVGPRPPCAAPPSGLVSWWRAEANANDSVGGNDGTFYNGARLAPGKVGQAFSINEDALDFNGWSYQYVEVPNSAALNPPGSFSIEGWIYPHLDGPQFLFSKWGIGAPYANNRSYAFGMWPGRGLFFGIADAAHQADGSFQQFGVTNVMTLNAWNHVAAVYDQTAGIRRLYVNGVMVGTKTNAPITVLNGSVPVRIGADNFTTTALANPFCGLIDELSFYSVALSANDIQAIYAAGSVGKCKDKEPPFIITQPASRHRVNVGTDAQFDVVATGSLTLHYQWFKDNVALPGATGASLVLTNIQDAQAGVYTVQVTNGFGSVVSSDALLTVNHAPVADASATVPVVISPNNTNATVVLNGSRSLDPDGDPLNYQWVQAGTTNLLATGMVAVVTLPVGTNSMMLAVDDGLATGTQTITVEVITAAQATERLLARASAQAPRAKPLAASLSAALASIERGNLAAAINQLQAFQDKVRAQVAPTDPTLANQLIQAAEEIMESLGGGSGRGAARFTAIHRPASGKTQLQFDGKHGRIYIIEASNDLANWEKVGVAADRGGGQFEFEDARATGPAARFYRVVSP